MLIKLSDDIRHAVEVVVRKKMGAEDVLDVNAAAEEIRVVFADRNIAREDIAASVAQFAVQCGYPIEFAALAPPND